MKTFLLATAVIFALASLCRAQILYNGNFETGNLSGWTTFTTANGSLGPSGLPPVAQFDVTGSGTPSYAAQFEVGELTDDQTQQGGGIYQTFNVSGGVYSVSADFAAYSPYLPTNLPAGVGTVSIDSLTVATVDLGSIGLGQTNLGSIQDSILLSGGTHQITIEFTRAGVNNQYTPLEYVDNVMLSPVPEPSVTAFGMFGLAAALFRPIRRKARA